jgi:hypothetical protein
MDIKLLKELIANNETEESLDELSKWTTEKNYEIQNTIIQLRRRFKELRSAEMTGALSFQEISQEKAKINNAILDLLQQLENPDTQSTAPRKAPAAAVQPPLAANQNSGSGKKTMVMVVAAIAVIVLVVILLSGGSDSEGEEDMGTESPGMENQFEESQPEENGTFDNTEAGAPAEDVQQAESIEGEMQQETNFPEQEIQEFVPDSTAEN